MTIPNLRPSIFVPGKIIQVRNAEDPLILSKLVLISVEEHVRHVVEMLDWLFPDATQEQRAGAALHDVHKKVGARYDFFHACGRKPAPAEEHLLADFYGDGNNCVELAVSEASEGYLEFVQDQRHRRLWPVRGHDGNVSDVRLDLDPPFGNHAADATEADLKPYRNGSFVLADDHARRGYVLNLVHLHHSFQPDRIIGACAEHGEQLARDLYRLIVADHVGSRWAEYVVQQLEAGAEKEDRIDIFGDVEIEGTEVFARGVDGELFVGAVHLRRPKYSGETADAPEIELLVRYYPADVNWHLRELVEQETVSTKQRPQQRRASMGRARRKRS